MGSWFEKQGKNIAKFAENLGKKIENELTQSSHQSSLEIYGMVAREVMLNGKYYNKYQPYAYCADNGYLKGNKAYVSISGWRPATFEVKKLAVDKEFYNISKNFNIQK